MLPLANPSAPGLDRDTLADKIAARLNDEAPALRAAFRAARIGSFVLDDLLCANEALAIHDAFPASDRMVLRRSMKENKHVGVQVDAFDPLIEEAIYAFQAPPVVRAIASITGLRALEPDADLYAGGISAMGRGAFLRPHLDNSHDAKRARYRVLNLLYYVTPGWRAADGGSLELWDEGPRGPARAIPSLFNRLVVMVTNRSSWHSVSEVTGDGRRACVSNYYFSAVSPEEQDYFHATSFRGRPEDPLTDIAMRADNALRTAVLRATGDRLFKNPHVYQRSEGDDGDGRDGQARRDQ